MGDGTEANILLLAARGDRDAMVVLRDEMVAEATAEQGLFRAGDLMAQAEIMARFAACLGNPADKAFLASFLFARSFQAREDGCENLADLYEADGCDVANQVLALNDPVLSSSLAFTLSHLADQGDEWAAIALHRLVEDFPPETIAALSAHARHLDQQVEAR